MLGTGNALASECYNTCFIISDEGRNFLVDAGGGNGILHQIKHAGFSFSGIHDAFISHSHIDHLLGAVWVVRIAAQMMSHGQYDGDINIYSHDEVIALVDDLAKKLLLPYQYNYVGKRIHLLTLNENETRNIIGHDIKFFDICSPRTKQFGFTFYYDVGKRLVFCGDESLKASCECYVKNCEWLLHESFCLYEDAEIFKPYEKYHSTVKDSCELAERLGVKNLLLYHTEDSDLLHRKERYTTEGKIYYSGNILVPDDLETIEI